MTNVERFNKTMNFEKVDRYPMVEWASYWNETLAQWHKQGLSGDLKGAAEIRSYFGLDTYLDCSIYAFTPDVPEPAFEGAGWIKNEQEYDGFLKYLHPEKAFDKEFVQKMANLQSKGEAVIWVKLPGFFWHPRNLFGIEGHMMAFYDHPELMHRINSEHLAFCLKQFEEFCKICKPQFITFAEDMSYNHGPMLSKGIFDEFLAPYYKKIIPAIKQNGTIPFVDSDGLVYELIPWLKEVGIEGILPLERMAGVDVAKIRQDHPDFKMIGGFDKTVMKDGEEAMRKEFERLLPIICQGGFIPSVDHQTPPDVSIENYKEYVSLLKEYAKKAANMQVCLEK